MIISEELKKKILNSYVNEEKSMSRISRELGIYSGHIKKILQGNNINIRYNGYYYKKKFDLDFFKIIDSEVKAYWLGFIYADGCLTKNILSVKLAIRDVHHLEKFKGHINSEHKIVIGVNNNGYGYGKGNQHCSISINDPQLAVYLKRLGVVHRKTFKITFSSDKLVPEHLKRHFIRGYFDGDGSVYLNSSKLNISFIGNERFIKSLLIYLKKNIPTKCNPYRDKRHEKVWVIKLGGKLNIKQFYNYIYKDATVYLDRKKDKFDSIYSV